ncbi:uncharacterized protein EKO05_0007611 [Ascochyta rabiei]|uniref:uncharacterized protein n=1 Tax=Didymella rabiei TaxID=5454 RepID=UPI0022045DB1|nr:uncharacterized protein EKO05_0007611 [Ascochyta rabiei]UPX17245.1 hypothetical protein EKO05_0007611 [Ascochyta rabiei]
MRIRLQPCCHGSETNSSHPSHPSSSLPHLNHPSPPHREVFEFVLELAIELAVAVGAFVLVEALEAFNEAFNEAAEGEAVNLGPRAAEKASGTIPPIPPLVFLSSCAVREQDAPRPWWKPRTNERAGGKKVLLWCCSGCRASRCVGSWLRGRKGVMCFGVLTRRGLMEWPSLLDRKGWMICALLIPFSYIYTHVSVLVASYLYLNTSARGDCSAAYMGESGVVVFWLRLGICTQGFVARGLERG